MTHFIEIKDKEYPCRFGMRAVFNLMNSNDVEFVDDVRVDMDYDTMLQLFEDASRTGVKREGGEKLTADQIEEAIDDDPALFMRLQKVFQDSKVIQKFNEQNAEESDEKK